VLGLAAIMIGWFVAPAAARVGYLAGALANVGTTLLLVGIVVLLERRIIDNAVRLVRTANEQTNEAIRAQLQGLEDSPTVIASRPGHAGRGPTSGFASDHHPRWDTPFAPKGHHPSRVGSLSIHAEYTRTDAARTAARGRPAGTARVVRAPCDVVGDRRGDVEGRREPGVAGEPRDVEAMVLAGTVPPPGVESVIESAERTTAASP